MAVPKHPSNYNSMMRPRIRRLSSREAARLMGAPDFHLSGAYTTMMSALGDAVNVDVVRWISRTYLNPLVAELCGVPRA
jgi:site-specific DNA-cytosine methylase